MTEARCSSACLLAPAHVVGCADAAAGAGADAGADAAGVEAPPRKPISTGRDRSAEAPLAAAHCGFVAVIGAAAFGGNGGRGFVVAALADTRAPLAAGLATAADGDDLTSFGVAGAVGVVDASVESESNSSRIEFSASSSSSSWSAAPLISGFTLTQLKNGAPQTQVLRLPMQQPSKVGFVLAKDGVTGVVSITCWMLASAAGECCSRE